MLEQTFKNIEDILHKNAGCGSEMDYEEYQAENVNYLEACNLEIDLLINFGAKSLEIKQLINPKFNQLNQSYQGFRQ